MRLIPPQWRGAGGAYDGTMPKRLAGIRSVYPYRLAESKSGITLLGRLGLARLPPARATVTDVVVLDGSTSKKFGSNPATATWPGTGSHITGPADRDLLLVLPDGVPRTVHTHVWGYRNIYLIGGVVKPTPDLTLTTTAAVGGVTSWKGISDRLIRLIPHPSAVDPKIFVSNIEIQNDPSLHSTSGGCAFGSLFSFGSVSATQTNWPEVYLQNLKIGNIPGWDGTLQTTTNWISRSEPIAFAEGGIKAAYLDYLDIVIGHRMPLGPSTITKPTAGLPHGTDSAVVLRNLQLRPSYAPTVFPYSQFVAIHRAASQADLQSGLYHNINLTSVYTQAHPLGISRNLLGPNAASGFGAALDRGTFVEAGQDIGTGKTVSTLVGQLNIGTLPDDVVPAGRLGNACRIATLTDLDQLGL